MVKKQKTVDEIKQEARILNGLQSVIRRSTYAKYAARLFVQALMHNKEKKGAPLTGEKEFKSFPERYI